MNGSHRFAHQTPSSWWYALCVVLALIPFGTGCGVFVYKLLHMTDKLVQVVVPGSAELKFDQPGTNTVFLEEESTVSGKIYSTSSDSISGLDCNVRAQDGSAIEISRTTGSTTYTMPGRRGKSKLEFFISNPGTYHFQCAYEEGKSGPEAVVAVGSGVGSAIVVSLLAFFSGIGGGAILGLASFLVIYRMQRRSARMNTGLPGFPAPPLQ